jgi:hypothetical protein
VLEWRVWKAVVRDDERAGQVTWKGGGEVDIYMPGCLRDRKEGIAPTWLKLGSTEGLSFELSTNWIVAPKRATPLGTPIT